jgi:hypothetical protein
MSNRRNVCAKRRRADVRKASVFFKFVVIMTAVFLFAPASLSQGEAARIADSILGVKIGMSLTEARAKLEPLGTTGGRDTRDGGRKEQWNLKETEYSAIVYKTDAKGKVVWVTGFVRPGQEIPFAKLGDPERATGKNDSHISWNVETPAGGYRLVAKGPESKARVVYLLSLAN